MTDRREFLKLNLAAMGIAAVPGAVWATSDANNKKFDLLVMDRDALKVGAAAFAHEARRVVMSGDLLSTWKQTLEPSMSGGAVEIAGISSGYIAFSLSEIARDFGYELVASAPYSANQNLRQLVSQKLSLSVFDLNRPRPTKWVMFKSGIDYRSAARA